MWWSRPPVTDIHVQGSPSLGLGLATPVTDGQNHKLRKDYHMHVHVYTHACAYSVDITFVTKCNSSCKTLLGVHALQQMNVSQLSSCNYEKIFAHNVHV